MTGNEAVPPQRRPPLRPAAPPCDVRHKRNVPCAERWASGGPQGTDSACQPLAAGASRSTYFCSLDAHISQPGPFTWPFCRLPIWLRAVGKTGRRPGDKCFCLLAEGLRCLPALWAGARVHRNLPRSVPGIEEGVFISPKSQERLPPTLRSIQRNGRAAPRSLGQAAGQAAILSTHVSQPALPWGSREAQGKTGSLTGTIKRRVQGSGWRVPGEGRARLRRRTDSLGGVSESEKCSLMLDKAGREVVCGPRLL